MQSTIRKYDETNGKFRTQIASPSIMILNFNLKFPILA